MNLRPPRRRPRDQGAVSLEVTIAAPLMILLAMFLILCGRAASAVIDVNAAAAAGARAAADATTPATAPVAAQEAVAAATAGTAWTCTTTTNPSGGLWRGGQVTVTVDCLVPLGDLGLPVDAGRTVTAAATEPVDTFRAISLGFANTEASSAANRSGGGL